MLNTIRNKASARAFLECDSFNFIVEACGLTSRENWHNWCDEDENKLKITKNKKVLIYKSTQNITKTSDLFKKSKPSHIATNSSWVMGVFGKKKALLLFLGNDGLLRASIFKKGVWEGNMAPVLLGYNFLKKVEGKYNMKSLFIDNEFKLFKMLEYKCSKLPCSDIKINKLLEKN